VVAQDHEATLLLEALAGGDESAAARLLPILYAELRALAGAYFRGQPVNHTLQPTALVHDAYLRLVNQPPGQWNNRAHFMAVAATAMRQILTDHARRKKSDKRGGDWQRVGLDVALARETGGEGGDADLDLVALDEAMSKLEAHDPRKHRIVELRFFGGLTVDEVAVVTGVSKTTVESDWRAARAWLGVELRRT
jgi:RNA polymerase sigma-70 factor, ECF subfamily